MYSKDEAYNRIAELTQRFSEQFASYKKSDYNETLTRRDFIDPFFKALGWDVDNSQGYAEAYREVIHEDRLKVGTATKAPDYSFRLPGGKRLFFVEAKKPSVYVKDELLPAYQVRRYGWSAKLSISLITDFEELAVYDCTKKPGIGDKASTGRIKYLTYKNYLDEFEFIWNTFSKGSVLKGSFDKFVAADNHKKGTATVDKAFLASLDEWRMLLAVNIAQRNQHLTEDELNFVVQQTIDRIIFLRIAEDRKVEEYGELQNILKGGKAEGSFYTGLYKLFVEADSKYNSGLFDFNKDKLSSHIHIDNRVLKNIVNELYYPICPYEFSVLGVEILGSAYEQFLGKQIKLDERHRAVIEEKPEVRKAGGVYYTPQYIVDYIVDNTVGKLLAGKTPADVQKITIVDPACGSGSFLLGAYDFLLRWHVEYYKPDFIKLSSIATSTEYNTTQRNNAIKERSKLPLTPEGNLTTAIKKQILLNNLYGVDLDTQAVEVTKLSLLLKCMEGETGSSINAQMRFGERVLPTLDNNIKSGNSLIDLDFYDTEHTAEEEKKVKPFSWEQAFPKVFGSSLRGTKQSPAQGGFDVVIGNPPWGAELEQSVRNYLLVLYPLVPTKTKDTYFYFLFKSFNLLKSNGKIGMIIPNTWLLINNASKVREHILKYKIEEIIDYGDGVFKDAIVETSSLLINKMEVNSQIIQVKKYKKGKLILENMIEASKWLEDPLKRITLNLDDSSNALMAKVALVSENFNKNCEIIFGIKPYQVGHGKPPQSREMVDNRIYHSKIKKDDRWKPFLTGTNINRYNIIYPGEQYIKYGEWLMYKSSEDKMMGEKIYLRRTSDKLLASLESGRFYAQNSLFIITSKTYSLKVLLGLLNSQLLNYVYQKRCPQVGKVFAEIKPSIIKELPIVILNDKNKHLTTQLIGYVNNILNLNKQKQTTTLSETIDQLNQRIAYTDDKINKLVYELYGLTDDEIAIVEGR